MHYYFELSKRHVCRGPHELGGVDKLKATTPPSSWFYPSGWSVFTSPIKTIEVNTFSHLGNVIIYYTKVSNVEFF